MKQLITKMTCGILIGSTALVLLGCDVESTPATPPTTVTKPLAVATPSETTTSETGNTSSAPDSSVGTAAISGLDGEGITQGASQASSTTASGTEAQSDTSAFAEPGEKAGLEISAASKQQLNNVISYANSHHTGASAGNCFNAVWGYLTSSGYGKLRNWGDLPNMKSGEARHFAEYMNGGQSHLDEAGLKRLDTNLHPPITSPHDERIPNGAVIVVAAGSYGTAHPTAGDIVIKAGPGHFVNDGPNMDYGTKATWYGKLLGVYIPK